MTFGRENLIELIKATGEDLIKNAEEIAPPTDNYTDFTITISYNPDLCPGIDISYTRSSSETVSKWMELYKDGKIK